MGWASRWAGGVGVVVLVASLRPAVADGPVAAPAAGNEKAFRAALDASKAHLAAGRGKEGLAHLKTTLEKHREQDYARAARPDLEDLARRLAFCADCPPPDPQSVVKGTLKKFVSKTGDIEIRYEAGKPNDFKTLEKGSLLFPARFRGPFTVAVKGASYPRKTDDAPMVTVGLEDNPKSGEMRMWRVYFGIAPYDEGNQSVWLPARIVEHDGDERKVLFEKEISPANAGKPYRFEVAVTSARVSATLNGSPLGSAAKAASTFGFFTLGLKGWSEIVVSGQIEPSWIQGQLDAVVDARRAAFERTFDVRSVLPAWVFDAPAEPATAASADDGDDAPDEEVPPELAADLLDLAKRVAADDFAGALEAIEALRKRGAPERLLGLLEARAHLGLDEPNKALAAIDRVIAADKDSVQALLVKAMVLYELGRDDEFAVAMRAATASPKAPLAVFEAATMYALLAGRPDDARAAVDAAARRRLSSPRLDALGKFVVRALNGPDWPKSFEFKSANYHVVSDIDVEICKVAAGVLEEALTQYRVRVRPLKAGPKRLYRVYLFSGKAGFERYRGDSSLFGGKGMENAAGIYSPMLKQLLIWNLESRDEMIVTIRHEGFHQYLDRLLPDPPVWFDEGLAVYYEGMKRVAGELRTDMARAEYLDALAGKDLVPLKAWVRIKPRDFYATSPHSYAQAWLFLHLLQHGTQKHRDLFKAFLTRLETASGSEAVDAVFDDATLAALDKDLAAHRAALNAKR
ncbi:MAG: DUF1570 domain-containing protein [Planctomycetia bacterium]|nr:DUF1570 domain-containing protein [Planctomycetia bacterium]